ncbi:MAG: ATP-binding protein, partial [Bacteroidota bacterium]
FDRFTQISDAQQGKPEGSGLGLYITRTIIENCGGSLNVETDYTEGAGFLVLLPLRAGAAILPEQNPSADSSTASSKPPNSKK